MRQFSRNNTTIPAQAALINQHRAGEGLWAALGGGGGGGGGRVILTAPTTAGTQIDVRMFRVWAIETVNVAVHWLRVGTIIAEFNMGCYVVAR